LARISRLAAPLLPPAAAANPLSRRISRPTLVPSRSEAHKPSPDVVRAPAPDRIALGIAAFICSTICFAMSDVSSKYLTAALPPVEVAWMRYFVFALVMIPVALIGRKRLFRTQCLGPQILRALTTTMSTILFIVAMMYLPVAEATSIGFVSPLLVTGLAIVFLGETVGLRRWIAAAVGLCGVLIIVNPGSGAFQPAALLPLAAALGSAASAIALRMMKNERAETTMAYSAFIGVGVLSIMVSFQWVMPSWETLAVGLLSGLLVTVANLLQIVAYRHTPASTLAPFGYAQLIWASSLGLAVFGIFPALSTFAGAAVIAARGVYTAYRERVTAMERTRAETESGRTVRLVGPRLLTAR
jgi:drug/metabolite transporter (DMT)-like permease